MPKKGVIPPQFLKHPPRSWKKDMRRVRSEAKRDTTKRRRSTGYGAKMTKRVRHKRPVRKIGAIPAIAEAGGVILGGATAVGGDVTTGAIEMVAGLVLGRILDKLGGKTELHKFGVKVSKDKELVIL